LLYSLDLLGTFAFGLSGGILAIKKGMDLFGVLVLALVTAIGGGTVREVMLGNQELFIFYNSDYIWVILASALAAFVFYEKLLKINYCMLLVDAVGLGTFVCIGVSRAISVGVPLFGAVIVGLITAVVGGMLRDIIAKEMPMILVRDFYAMACLIGASIYVFLYWLGLQETAVMLVSASVVIILRILAIVFHWNFIRKKNTSGEIG
jgi:uncharacterized membrane protein YeiH